MLWLQIDDIELLRDLSKEEILKAIHRNSEYDGVKNEYILNLIENAKIVVEPTNKKLRKIVKNTIENPEAKNSHTVVISFRSPKQTFWKSDHPFLHLRLRNEHFPMKQIEKDIGISEESVLSEKLGFRMVEPKYGFESVAGNFRLKEYISRLKFLTDLGLPISLSALMFFGTAGSGKTHVAQAIAKEFGYKFGYLDLPHFMTLPSPTQAIDELFDFLQDQDQRCVLLIDEIEKMFDFTGNDLKSKNVFGKLLTRLNDIYNDPKNNIVFIATANDISKIVEFAPEFMRKGRFDDIFFLSYPDEKSAMAIIELFVNKVGWDIQETFKRLLSTQSVPNKLQKLKLYIEDPNSGITIENVVEKLSILPYDEKEKMHLCEEIYHGIEAVYPNSIKISDDEEFIYSPPEIHTVIKELQNTALYELLSRKYEDFDEMPSVTEMLVENDGEMIQGVAKKISPLQVTAKKGIQRQIAQAENYNNRGNLDHEHYKKG